MEKKTTQFDLCVNFSNCKNLHTWVGDDVLNGTDLTEKLRHSLCDKCKFKFDEDLSKPNISLAFDWIGLKNKVENELRNKV